MLNSWIILLPPFVAISLALIIRRVRVSLVAGILLAAFIASDFSLIQTTKLSALSSWSVLGSCYNLFIFAFLIILGILITLINKTGAASAYGNFVQKRIKNRRNAETSSLILSSFLFIDDYLNSLTTGLVMRPLVDQFKIPRVKLAFLIDAMAASLCAISPISSWFAAIIAPLRNVGVTDTFWVFIHSIPFIFYSLIIITSAWFIVLRKISFGAMNKFELAAQKTNNTRNAVNAPTHENSSILDFVFPISILLTSVFASLLYSGDFYLFGGQNSLINALQTSDISLALFMSGIITLSLSTIYFLLKKQLKIRELPDLFFNGIKIMLPAITILILAWTFGSIIRDDLHTGQFLANIFVGSISIKFMPLIFFASSLLISLATGSAWGTIAIMIPIGIPMLTALLQIDSLSVAKNIPSMFPLIGSIISGAIAGDHISPISDTTIMSSTSAGTNHIDHVRTQIPYAFPAIFSTALAFFLAGFLMPYGYVLSVSISMIVGIGTSFCILGTLNYLRKYTSPPSYDILGLCHTRKIKEEQSRDQQHISRI